MVIDPSAFSVAKAAKFPKTPPCWNGTLPTLWLGNITASGCFTSSVYTWAVVPTALVLVMVNDLLPAVVGVPDK